MAERALTRKAATQLTPETAPASEDAPAEDPTAAIRAARTTAKARIARGGPLVWSLQALTALMHVDILLFGHIRSGPFFALLVKDPRTQG
jgi:hypothetical protein